MRRTIGTVIVALLVLISTLPAMCSQCEFTMAGQNRNATYKQNIGAAAQASRMAMPSKHCQHIANSQSSPPHLTSTGPCQDRPCQQLVDSATKSNSSESAKLAHSFRVVVAAVSGDDGLVAEDSHHSRIEKLPLHRSAYQPLSVSLRI